VQARTGLYEEIDALDRLYMKTGRATKAASLAKRALELEEQVGYLDAIVLAERLDKLADILTEQGRTEDAKPLRERAKSVRDKAPKAMVPERLQYTYPMRTRDGRLLQLVPLSDIHFFLPSEAQKRSRPIRLQRALRKRARQ
jgi:hypothetical protein